MGVYLFLAIFGALLGGIISIAVRSSLFSRQRDAIADVVVAGLASATVIVSTWLGASLVIVPAAAAGLLGALLILRTYVHFHRRSLINLQKLAPALRDFGLTNFDLLDGYGDGLITLGDLFVFEDRVDLSVADQEMIRTIRRLLPRIGHCIDYTVVIGAAGGPATVLYDYGISRKDLKDFPARVQVEYDAEFPAR